MSITIQVVVPDSVTAAALRLLERHGDGKNQRMLREVLKRWALDGLAMRCGRTTAVESAANTRRLAGEMRDADPAQGGK